MSHNSYIFTTNAPSTIKNTIFNFDLENMVVLETLLASTISGLILGEVAKANMRTRKVEEAMRIEEDRHEQVNALIEHQESLKREEEIRQDLEKHVAETEEELDRKADEIERERVKQTRSRVRISARRNKEEQEEKTRTEESKQERKLNVREKQNDQKRPEDTTAKNGAKPRYGNTDKKLNYVENTITVHKSELHKLRNLATTKIIGGAQGNSRLLSGSSKRVLWRCPSSQ
jgi:hypothetical protein